MKNSVCFCLFILACLCGKAQDTTYAERLAFPKGAKVVILHVDDVGMSFDSNDGAIAAMTKGAANSCSIMMPCPWVPAFAHYLAAHPGLDAGLHLTLTSEWTGYRWAPVAGKSAVPGLVDKEGALWPSVGEVVEHATPEEVEAEIAAQIDKARLMGISPTHLDSHMGTLFAKPAFLEKYIGAGIKNHIPVMLPAGHATLIMRQSNIPAAQMEQLRGLGRMLWDAGLPVIDDLHNYSYDWKPLDTSKLVSGSYKTAMYVSALRDLKPGITMIIMHCTRPTEVFASISDSGPSRKADLEAMLAPQFRKALIKEGIILTTWRELMKRRSTQASR